jgi:hypothetical protein
VSRKEQGVMMDHVAAHIVRPFEYLEANICEKSIRGGPASKDHEELADGVVVEE